MKFSTKDVDNDLATKEFGGDIYSPLKIIGKDATFQQFQVAAQSVSGEAVFGISCATR